MKLSNSLEPTFDQKFLDRAIALSEENIEKGSGGPFGAVLVKDGQLIAEGTNLVTSKNDPTAHAEVEAIRNACKALNHFDLSGLVLYSSCEPCPMCLSAAYWARISVIYFANNRTDAAAIGFSDADIYEEFTMPAEAKRIALVVKPSLKAQAVFTKWLNKADKINY